MSGCSGPGEASVMWIVGHGGESLALSRSTFRERRPSCVAAAMLAILQVSCGSKPEPVRPNVVLITIDTLRADRLGCYGNPSVETPAIDQLARDGVLFQRAIAQVPLTAPSHAAILTGTYPTWNGMRDWTDPGLRPDIPTLAEIFKRHGYSTAAFVSAFVLDSMWGLHRGFDVYDDWFEAQDYKLAKRQSLERSAEKTVDRSIAWIASRPPGPFFLWVHLFDPHSPYSPPEPFRSRYQGRPYDGEVAYSDQQMGRLVQYLRDRNLYASSLILLTSDHGEALGEHQEQEHGYYIYDSSMHVPLVVKFPAPSLAARRSVPQVVNTIDIAPTLVQSSGLPASEMRPFQGLSLLALVSKDPGSAGRFGYSESIYPRSLVGTSGLFGLRTERYHYIQAPRAELYDLEQDPGEKRNILREKPAIAQSLQQALQDVISRHRQTDRGRAGESIDPETKEKLRSLGYVSIAGSKLPAEDDPNAPDPKDRIATYNQILKAMELSDRGAWKEANALLAPVAIRYPHLFLIPFLQGENLRALKNERKAIAQYRRALELNPAFDQAAVGLGHAAYAVEDNMEAVKAFDLALQLNRRNFLARLALARVYWRLGRLEEAATEQLQVLEEHPHFAQAHAEYGVTLVRLKRYQEGLQAITKGIAMGYRDATVYNFLANAHLAGGNAQEAIRAYDQAISLDPNYPTPLVNLALLYQERGDHVRAREYYQRACRISAELCRQLGVRLR